MLKTFLSYFSITDPKPESRIDVGSWWTVDADEERWVIVQSIEANKLVHFTEHHCYQTPIKKVLPWNEFLYQHSPLENYNQS